MNDKLNKNPRIHGNIQKNFTEISVIQLYYVIVLQCFLIGCKTTDTMGSLHGIEIRNIYYRKKF